MFFSGLTYIVQVLKDLTVVLILTIICSIDLILYIPINNFSIMLGQVFLGRTSTKQGLMCLAQGHNADKHSTTEPPIDNHDHIQINQ